MTSAYCKPSRSPLARLHWLCLAVLAVCGTLQLAQAAPASQNELVALRSAWGWADLALGPAPAPVQLATVPHAAIPLWVQLPAVAALLLGRVAGFGWFGLLLTARIAGFACSAALCALALRVTPTGKKLFMVCCLLPPVVTLLTSATTLRPAFGLAMLFLAQVLAIAQSPVQLPPGRWLLMELTGLALVLTAPICLPLLGAAALIPARRWAPRQTGDAPARGRRFFAVLGRWLLALVLLGLLAAASWLLLTQYAGEAHRLWMDLLFSSSIQTEFANPLLPTVTLQQVALPLQWLQTLAWAFLLAWATLTTPLALRPARRQRWLALGCCAVCAAAWWALALFGLPALTGQTLVLTAPLALWALTPTNIQLRREDPLPLALWCLAATALGHLNLFGIIGLM